MLAIEVSKIIVQVELGLVTTLFSQSSAVNLDSSSIDHHILHIDRDT